VQHRRQTSFVSALLFKSFPENGYFNSPRGQCRTTSGENQCFRAVLQCFWHFLQCFCVRLFPDFVVCLSFCVSLRRFCCSGRFEAQNCPKLSKTALFQTGEFKIRLVCFLFARRSPIPGGVRLFVVWHGAPTRHQKEAGARALCTQKRRCKYLALSPGGIEEPVFYRFSGLKRDTTDPNPLGIYKGKNDHL